MTQLIKSLKSSIQPEPKVDPLAKRMDRLEKDRKRAERTPVRKVFH